MTEEKSLDGRLVLSKRGDPSVCIEHHGGNWNVKNASDKGKTAAKAYVAGGCALEDCTSRVWKVDDGIPEHPFQDQPSVKMVTGKEAERQVSGCCVRAHAHAHDVASCPSGARSLHCNTFQFLSGRGACGC